jgi:translocation and assembly module TamA
MGILRTPPVIFLLLLAAASCALAQAQALRYKVRIEAPRELRGMLEDGLQLTRWQSDPQMNAQLLERLVAEAEQEVREAVATRGYFSAKVTSSIERAGEPWTVVLRVEPGPATHVAGAEVKFSGPVTDDPQASSLLARIRKEWKLRPGERFTQDAWNDAKASASRMLADWRYAAARVAHSRALVDPVTGQAALDVDIASGPAFRYGPVQVRGTERYAERMVEEQSPAKPGELYERETLRLYERRLLATGYFVSAQAGIAPDVENAESAPVRVSVIEAKSQQVETGLSFNTDVGLRGEARYRNLNPFGTAWRLRSEVQLDRKIQRGRVDLDAPPEPGGRWRSHFIQARQTKIENVTDNETSAGVAQNWGLGGELSALIVSGHLEEQRIGGLLSDHRHAIYFGYRTQLRNTDSWESPRRGYLVDLSAGGSPSVLASRQFVRGTARGLLFIPVRRDDFLLRAEIGVVLADSREGIPSSFVFRTGGDQTVRGYAFESLGVQTGNGVVGGRRLAVGSAEYTHWVASSTPAMPGTAGASSRLSASARARAFARPSGPCARTSRTASSRASCGCISPSGSRFESAAENPRSNGGDRRNRADGARRLCRVARLHPSRYAVGARARKRSLGRASAHRRGARHAGGRNRHRHSRVGERRPARRRAHRSREARLVRPARRHGAHRGPACRFR